MPQTQDVTLRDILEFRAQLELGGSLFETITGVPSQDVDRFRRGRSRDHLHFVPDLNQRIERCYTAFNLAQEMLGHDEEKALDWLYAESPLFKGQSPIDIAFTEDGLSEIQHAIDAMRKLANGQQPVGVRPQPSPQAGATSKVRLEAQVPEVVQSEPRGIARAQTVAAVAPKIADSRQPEATLPKAPGGVAEDDRVFALKERLAPALKQKEWTVKRLGDELLAAGLQQFKSKGLANRLANSYAYATWNEVLAIAKLLDIDAGKLAGKPRV